MNLSQWLTNSPEVNNQIKPKDHIEERVTKVLNLVWNTNAHKLSISTKKLEIQQPATSTNNFSIHLRPTWNVNTVYNQHEDIYPKFMRKGLDWDDKLDKDKETWKKMTRDLHKFSSIQIPRFIGNGTIMHLRFIK